MLCTFLACVVPVYILLRWMTGFAYRAHLTRKRPRRYKTDYGNGGWF